MYFKECIQNSLQFEYHLIRYDKELTDHIYLQKTIVINKARMSFTLKNTVLLYTREFAFVSMYRSRQSNKFPCVNRNYVQDCGVTDNLFTNVPLYLSSLNDKTEFNILIYSQMLNCSIESFSGTFIRNVKNRTSLVQNQTQHRLYRIEPEINLLSCVSCELRLVDAS